MKRYYLAGPMLAITFIMACSTSTNKNNAMETKVPADSVASNSMVKSEMYTCTMHNEVMGDQPGKCPKCEMTLVKQMMTAEQMKMMKEGTSIKPKD
ncbi:MAG: heavy metal-binding domain-containing protein [Ginsengibacter sp.]